MNSELTSSPHESNNPVTVKRQNSIGIISINYPPVNALSQPVRLGLCEGIESLEQEDDIKAIIIRCEQRTFIAGADIKEFGKTPLEPHLPDVVNRIEACNKPVISSMFGTSLGGGFEVALACHYRVVLSGSKVGLPEVNLGLIPGAGGTQRLPRIVGCQKALEMITSGKHYSVDSFSENGLFDKVIDSNENLDLETLNFAVNLVTRSNTLARSDDSSMIDDIDDWQLAIDNIVKQARGKIAPIVAAELIRETRSSSVLDGMKLERQEFVKLRDSEQSAALRFVFGAERAAAKTEFSAAPLNVNKVGIIGGGTMGAGIATAFLSSGFNVVLIEQNKQALDLGQERINKIFSSNLKRGRISKDDSEKQLANLNASVSYDSLAECDLVIEAVFENMQVKKDIFTKLDSICKKECILATNTSYLDINEIASVVGRPEQVIGMHFFSPANIMKLLEVVQAKKSSEQALVTAMAVAKKLGKISVLVGVCFGFAGNRMYTRYGREVQQMLLEGATVQQIDSALTSWGMAMGPLAVADMSGIDIGVNARNSQPFPEFDPGYFKPSVLMFEQGRFGRKTGAGYYSYNEQDSAQPDESVTESILQQANNLGISQQYFSEEEIVNRCIYALISEGMQLLKDGIVQRASDIDVIWLHGYGFPRYKGGPMFQAKALGIENVKKVIEDYRAQFGNKIWPKINFELLK